MFVVDQGSQEEAPSFAAIRSKKFCHSKPTRNRGMVTDRVLIHPYSADFALRSSRTPWFRLRFSPETGADGLSAVRRSRVVQDLANDLFLAALGKFLLITLLWGTAWD